MSMRMSRLSVALVIERDGQAARREIAPSSFAVVE